MRMDDERTSEDGDRADEGEVRRVPVLLGLLAKLEKVVHARKQRLKRGQREIEVHSPSCREQFSSRSKANEASTYHCV